VPVPDTEAAAGIEKAAGGSVSTAARGEERRVNRDFLARWSWRWFLAIGVVLLIVGAVVLVLTVRFVAEAEHATGTVVDLSRRSDSDGTVSYYPVVRFVTANGEAIEFVSSTGSSPASESPGDRVEVLYDPDDPKGAQLSGILHVWLPPIVLAIIGAVSVAEAGRRRMRMTSVADGEWLRAHGHHLNGDSPRVVTDSVEIDGRSPFHLEVDIHDATRDEVRVLTSDPIWFDPTPHLENRKTLDVYVDPGRPERYLVDISFLPRLAD
jgi:Protein of unknown function (DUF3592)